MLRRIQLALAIVLGLFLFQHGVVAHPERQTDPKISDNAWIKGWYNSDNETYFQNQLPNIPVTWDNLGQDKNGNLIMGDTAESTPDNVVISIRLDRYTNVTAGETIMTLRHEECHVKVDPSLPADADPHGAEFQSCMISLAEAGAFKGWW